MPDPTDFVTSLPADFEIFGDAVDTTLEAIETKLDVITTEGDLIVGDASGDPVRVPVGTAGQILASDGDTVEWVAPSAGGANYTLLNTGGTTLSGTTTISGISDIENILIVITGATGGSTQLVVRINGDSGANQYDHGGFLLRAEGSYTNTFIQDVTTTDFNTSIPLGSYGSFGGAVVGSVKIDGGTQSGFKSYSATGSADTTSNKECFAIHGIYKGTAPITSVSVLGLGGSLTGGTIFVYGA
jgi:hypothetical protein